MISIKKNRGIFWRWICHCARKRSAAKIFPKLTQVSLLVGYQNFVGSVWYQIKAFCCEAASARERSPIAKKISVVYLSEKFWLTRDFTSARPGPSSTPQGSQCEMSHFLASVEVATWYWTAMLWSIDSCQIRVSADQYHSTVSRVQVSPIEVTCFLKFSRDKLLIFNWSQAQLQVDFFAIVTSLSLFEVNHKFFNVSFAFSPN